MRRTLLAIVTLGLIAVPAVVSAAAVLRGPYLQRATPTAVVVRWRTNLATDSTVWIGDAPASLPIRIELPAAVIDHEVELTGLTPATRYYYAVGTATGPLVGGDLNHRFVTPPAAGSVAPLRAWIIGDAGTGGTDQRAVRDVYDAVSAGYRTDLWLMLGDNAYPSGTDPQYQLAVFDMYRTLLRTSPVWPTLGNHDALSASSATESGVYYDAFTLPRAAEAGGVASGTEAYYSFDHANLHFVCLDSMDSSRRPGSAMLVWLAADLAANTADWTIAFWHHPPYSKGSHDSDSEAELKDMRQYVLPILEANGVDLVLGGHSHSYERSFLLDGHYGRSNTLSPAMKIDGGDGREDGTGAYRKPAGGPAAHQGAVYAVAGSSGRIEGGTLDHPAMFISLNQLGSMVLEVNGGRLDATFLDSSGGMPDHFTLLKGSAPPRGPIQLAASAASAVSADLTWIDRAIDETGFRIERSDDGVAFALVATVAADVTAHTDTGLVAAATYDYRVTAFNLAGDSATSNVAAVTLPDCPAVDPVGATLLLVKPGGGAAIEATWGDIATATGYDLLGDPAKDGAFVTVVASAASGQAPGLSFAAPADTTYFRVAGTNACRRGPAFSDWR